MLVLQGGVNVLEGVHLEAITGLQLDSGGWSANAWEEQAAEPDASVYGLSLLLKKLRSESARVGFFPGGNMDGSPADGK